MTSEARAVTINGRGLRAKPWFGWIARLGRSTPRRLRLAESLALGDRRFVAVVEFDGSRFLLGGTASSLVLLARLGDEGGEDSLSSPSEPSLRKPSDHE